MSDITAPEHLYYATVTFTDGTTESPRFLVFDSLLEGVITVKEHFAHLDLEIDTITMKELEYCETVHVPDDASILIPHNDKGKEDDFYDKDHHESMIHVAEENYHESVYFGIHPDPINSKELLCDAYLMSEVVQARTPEEYITYLKNNPIECSDEVFTLYLYRRTGNDKEIQQN